MRGYHVYQDIWTANIGKVLGCEKEPWNTADPYAAATISTSVTVGYVPREFSCVFSTFLSYSGSIECIKTDSRRYSADLVQGDLEVTCTYTLAAADREWIQKVRKHLEEEGAQFDDVSFDKDATKLLAGVEDTVNIDNSATAATSEIPDNTTNGGHMPVTINVPQYYIASKHSYAARSLQNNCTLGTCNDEASKKFKIFLWVTETRKFLKKVECLQIST